MIERDSRNDLASLIRRYLDEEMLAFDLDESLERFRDSSDSAVKFVARTMWYHYDDCDDHLIVANKPEWDYFQRLLLLLESNSTVAHERRRQWSITQPVAACALASCLLIALQFGVGYHLLIFFIPFGCISIALSRYRVPAIERGPYDDIVTPFSSIADLRTAYNSARTFTKLQFPRQIETRLIRSPVVAAFWTCHMYLMWAILAPAPLLVQCAPLSFDLPIVKPA